MRSALRYSRFSHARSGTPASLASGCKVAAAGDVHAHDDLRVVPFRTKAAEPVCTGDIGLVVALADGVERNVDPLIQQALHVIQIGRQVDVAQHHPAQVNAKALEDLQLLQMDEPLVVEVHQPHGTPWPPSR